MKGLRGEEDWITDGSGGRVGRDKDRVKSRSLERDTGFTSRIP